MPHPILFFIFCVFTVLSVLIGLGTAAKKGNPTQFLYALIFVLLWALLAAWAYGWPWFGLLT